MSPTYIICLSCNHPIWHNTHRAHLTRIHLCQQCYLSGTRLRLWAPFALSVCCICVETFQKCFTVVDTSWSRLNDASSTQFHKLSSHSLPLASLVFSLPRFKTCLKFYQWVLLAPVLEPFSPSEKGAYQMLVDQVLNTPSHSQKAQFFSSYIRPVSMFLTDQSARYFCYSFLILEWPRQTLPVLLILEPNIQGNDSILNCLIF